MRPFLTLFLLASTLSACIVEGEGSLPPADWTGKPVNALGSDGVLVVDVRDGDTLDIIVNDVEDTVRVKGINSPELTTEPPQPFAEEAQTFTREHTGSAVALTFDSHCPQNPMVTCRDSFNRLLAYVTTAGGDDLGAELLRNGLARIYIFDNENFDRRAEYQALVNQAQADGTGLWGAPQ